MNVSTLPILHRHCAADRREPDLISFDLFFQPTKPIAEKRCMIDRPHSPGREF